MVDMNPLPIVAPTILSSAGRLVIDVWLERLYHAHIPQSTFEDRRTEKLRENPQFVMPFKSPWCLDVFTIEHLQYRKPWVLYSFCHVFMVEHG